MNYIWDVLFLAKKQKKELKEIRFKVANLFSPYMELSYENINCNELKDEVEINPYYRFNEVFNELLDVNYKENKELKEVLFDITIHFLNQIDLLQGMNKEEYYRKIIWKEIKKGVLGERVKENFKFFSIEEQKEIVYFYYQMNIIGGPLLQFNKLIKKIFKGSNVYINKKLKDEIIIYLNKKKDQNCSKKLELIKFLFLPLRFKTIEHWEKHFGIIGVNESMKIDEMSIY